jgi:predicted DNA-binding transcriptional regulator AlpA
VVHWTEQSCKERVARGVARSKAKNAAVRDAARELRLIRRELSPYMNIAEFAEMMGLARSTINRLRNRKPAGFPVEYSPAGRVMFKRSEVMEWAESQPLSVKRERQATLKSPLPSS